MRFSQRRLALFLLTASLLLSVPGPLLAATSDTTRNQPPFPARCELYERDRDLAMLQDMQINSDGVFEGWARVYLIEEELQKLRTLGFEVTVLPDRAPEMARRLREEPPTPRGTRAVPATYHTYATLTAELQQIATDHPTIAELISIGQTEQGREMWMMKLSDNLGIDEDEPEFAYISSMHGDEVVGKELCVNLINYLTDKRFGFPVRGVGYPLWTDVVESIRAGSERTPGDFVDQFSRCHIERSGYVSALHECFHGSTTGPSGVEDENFVSGFL